MSRWGEGNFDTDMARDLLFLLVRQLAQQIQDCLDDEERPQLFCGETEVMPCMDILLTLSRAYPDMALPALRDYPLADWKKKYLGIFDQHSDLPVDNKFQIERRSVILDTFSQLENLVESYV